MAENKILLEQGPRTISPASAVGAVLSKQAVSGIMLIVLLINWLWLLAKVHSNFENQDGHATK